MKLQFCFLAALFMGTNAMAVEEPKFETVIQEAKFEVRQYGAFIVAETWVDGDMDAASGKGFSIADYIFGNNTASQHAASEKIAMTAPVTMQPQIQSGMLAMTAPVVERRRSATVRPRPLTAADGPATCGSRAAWTWRSPTNTTPACRSQRSW